MGEAAGKTAFAVALGVRWQGAGVHLAYLKLRFSPPASGAGVDLDAEFVPKVLASVSGSTQSSGVALLSVQASDQATLRLQVSKAVGPLPDDALLLLEPEGHLADSTTREPLPGLVAALEARVLLVVGYHQAMEPGPITEVAGRMGPRLAGVVLNRVPASAIPEVREGVTDELARAGVPVLGIIPESRLLYGFTVGELADHLHAEYLCLPEKREHLIENVMLGGNPPDPAFLYFAPKPNKAVICRSDRPDIQLAVLDTDTRCLVFTGGGRVQTSVLYRAEDLGVPVLRVSTDTISTVQNLTGLVEGQRFRQQEKIPVLQGLLEQHFDFEKLGASLGIG